LIKARHPYKLAIRIKLWHLELILSSQIKSFRYVVSITKKRDEIKKELDSQQKHWNKMYSEDSDFFGKEPSYAARKAAKTFKKYGKSIILELGAGEGRDSLFFGQNGFHVCALDYSNRGVDVIKEKAQKIGISRFVEPVRHDIRQPLPFPDASFDACYCHMLYCMALCTSEIEALFQEVKRLLKIGGLNIYTVRHTGDAHYRKGKHIVEDMYEFGGFVVHFFSQEKVKQLAKGYDMVSIEEFEEGELPRKLFLVTLRKV
jgi:SAM-dependent methyltransferase